MNAPLKSIPQLERAEGKLHVSIHNKGHGHALGRLVQDGCLKARFPVMHDDSPKRGVLINTTGGIADGDQLTTEITVSNGASFAVTTQAAERIYRARDMNQPAEVNTLLTVGDQGLLFWLPQETILFDGGAVHRRYDLDLAEDATFVGGEMLVLGRTAMKEQVNRCNLFDRWQIRSGGKLVFADGFRLSGELTENARSAAQLENAITYATLFVVGPHAETAQQDLRSILEDQDAVTAGCSLRGAVLICRFAATDAKALTALLGAVITAADNTITGTQSVTQAILPRWIF